MFYVIVFRYATKLLISLWRPTTNWRLYSICKYLTNVEKTQVLSMFNLLRFPTLLIDYLNQSLLFVQLDHKEWPLMLNFSF